MRKVSIVEDNPDNRLLLQAMLGQRYALTEYANGPDALAGFRTDRPDVVLMDISLPGLDGEGVLQEIRGDHDLRDLRVVAVTAHNMEGDRERFLAAGFDAYLAKPIFDDRVLIAAIEDGACGARTGS